MSQPVKVYKPLLKHGRLFAMLTFTSLLFSVDSSAFEGCWNANTITQLFLDHGSAAQESVLRVPDKLCFVADGSIYDGAGLAYRGSWAQAGKKLKIDFNPAYYENLLQPQLTARLGLGARVSVGTATAYGEIGANEISSELTLDNTTIFDGEGTAVGKMGKSGFLQATLNPAKTAKTSRTATFSNTNAGSYEGHWESIRGGAGNVFSSSVFISINIKSDGSFSGRYQKYRQTSSAGMCNPLYCFGFSVWNPRGPARKVKGNINFDTLTGTISFHGLRKVNMSVEILSDNELYMSLPPRFRYAWVKVRR